jgi:hypothetical protein
MLLLLSTVVLESCADSDAVLQQSGDLPEAFLIDEISLAMLPSELRTADDSRASVLAWNKVRFRREKGPALEVWSCLVWQKCKVNEESPRWVLKTLFRHPQYKNVWRWAADPHSSQEGLRVYTYPPTMEDVYDFLYAAEWDLSPELPGAVDYDPDQILGAGLCAEEWMRRFGSLPEVPIPQEDPAAREARESRGFQRL